MSSAEQQPIILGNAWQVLLLRLLSPLPLLLLPPLRPAAPAAAAAAAARAAAPAAAPAAAVLLLTLPEAAWSLGSGCPKM
jgi:hypothetical protein